MRILASVRLASIQGNLDGTTGEATLTPDFQGIVVVPAGRSASATGPSGIESTPIIPLGLTRHEIVALIVNDLKAQLTDPAGRFQVTLESGDVFAVSGVDFDTR